MKHNLPGESRWPVTIASLVLVPRGWAILKEKSEFVFSTARWHVNRGYLRVAWLE